jgi:hypothetical protein
MVAVVVMMRTVTTFTMDAIFKEKSGGDEKIVVRRAGGSSYLPSVRHHAAVAEDDRALRRPTTRPTSAPTAGVTQPVRAAGVNTLSVSYCALPLLMHSFCMQHQVNWLASLAAIDNT